MFIAVNAEESYMICPILMMIQNRYAQIVAPPTNSIEQLSNQSEIPLMSMLIQSN